MREILFRGKRADNGEWVDGYFVKGRWYLEDRDIFAIIPTDVCFYPHCEIDEYIEVDPETICQYTGLTDKNGKKIFEGDIVKYIDHEYIGKIIFKEGGFKINWGFYAPMLKKDLFFWTNKRDIEVIGNIFDNTDLFTTSHTDSD